MSCILFSPIGGSDPIRNFRDGSMLHICRNYLPDKLYLYLSYEMYEYHKKDNRYLYCVKKLEEQCGHKIDVELIIRENLKDVQDYEIFYEDFRKCIANIEDSMNEEDELLVNVSSGTPAMKSALVVLSTLAEFPFKSVQVPTPLRRSNYTDENMERYDVKEQWECNEDNEGKKENRCLEVKSVNLLTLWKVNIIKKHLSAYDYSAACQVANEMEGRLSKECILYLEQALERMRLNSSRVNSIAKETGYQPMPVTKDEDCVLIEYILNLQVKDKRGTYDDFVRGITPAIFELLERALKCQCDIDINRYCSARNHVRRWDDDKLKGSEILAVFESIYGKGRFKSGNVYSVHLKDLILHFSKNQKLKTLAENLRLVEEKVRNPAAHTMTSITQDLVKRWTKYSTKDILQMMKDIIKYTGIRDIDKNKVWESYDRMNEEICRVLEKDVQLYQTDKIDIISIDNN